MTDAIDMGAWAEAEIRRLKAAIRKLQAEPVPDLDLIAAHKRVLVSIENLSASLAVDRRYVPLVN